MYSFKNDYSELCHPEILDFLVKNAKEQFDAYGYDRYSSSASNLIKKLTNPNADVHFIAGGTQTNIVLISSILKRHEAVICCDTAHINVHETGAIESKGIKLLTCQNVNGKITPNSVEDVVFLHTDEHTVKPKLVFISQATELGTTYTIEELANLRQICDKYNLYLYVDGARLGSAIQSIHGVSLKEISKIADAFYIGGTKNGALFGEALVLINNEFKKDFRYYIKQNGAMLAKSAAVGIMFYKLFNDSLFFKLATHANVQALIIQDALVKKGYKLKVLSNTNQIFPILPNSLIEMLKKEFSFHIQEKINDNESCVRFVTSWATDEKEVKRLVSYFQ